MFLVLSVLSVNKIELVVFVNCSIGSLGANGGTSIVEDVHVRDCTFKGTKNGARIKTWQVTNHKYN